MNERSTTGLPNGSGVRLKYASLVMYALNIGGAIFALYFITLLTRRVTVDEYGIYVMIMRYVSYFLVPSAVYAFWIGRNISRGQNTSRTGVYTSLVFALGSLPIYLAVMWFVSSQFNQPLLPLILSAGILILELLNSSINAVSGGYAPQYVGYGTFIQEFAQAISAYIIIGLLALGLTGVMLVAIVARALMIAVGLYLNRSMIVKSKFDRDVFFSWLKSSWLPLLWNISGILATFDVVIVRFFYQTEVPIAFFGICQTVLALSLFSGVVISSLYPKIVSKKNIEDLREALWLLLLLSLPIVFLIILYAAPICALFGLNYLPDALALKVYAIVSVVQLLANLSSTVYLALESVDASSMSTSILLKSALFKNNLVLLVINIFYLVLIAFFSIMKYDTIFFVMLWSASVGIVFLSQFLICTHLIKRDFGFKFPFKQLIHDLAYFIIPLLLMVVPSLLISVQISESFYQTFLSLVIPVALSLTLYLLALLAIDNRFRSLARQILNKFAIWRQV